jgi:hypothetical protein
MKQEGKGGGCIGKVQKTQQHNDIPQRKRLAAGGRNRYIHRAQIEHRKRTSRITKTRILHDMIFEHGKEDVGVGSCLFLSLSTQKIYA